MTESHEQRFLRIISGESRTLGASLARCGLAGLEPFYAAAVGLRNFAFDRGLRSTHHAPRPVVSVGNLTTGGTGKTPVVAWLADALRRRLGGEVAILTRGYKAAGGASDEATLLRDRLSGAPKVHVLVDADRAAAATKVGREFPNIRALVMDDGFQHRRLHRDFDLVLIDATNPFGHDRLLPRGLLREPVVSLRRAHAILITRANQATVDGVARIVQRVRAVKPDLPVFESSHCITGFQRPGGKITAPTDLSGARLLAFAGIGNPKSFEASLAGLEMSVVAHHWFRDHHAYDERSIEQVIAMARVAGADALVTTEKDAVKLRDLSKGMGLPLYISNLTVEFAPGHDEALLSLILDGSNTRGFSNAHFPQ